MKINIEIGLVWIDGPQFVEVIDPF
jgi:hypothetical protein